jgi:hypothetical protein
LKAISNSKECPSCGGGHKSRPFCRYENGWYCFSCGYTKTFNNGFVIHEQRNVIPDWPEASSRLAEFSLEAQLWLAKYNITEQDVRDYNIYYTDDNSLIYAVLEPQLFYQKRKMDERIITTYGQKLTTLLEVSSICLVIVEDYISAINVHKAGYNALCLWGTKIAYKELEAWFKKFDKCLVWLDNDAEKQTNSGQDAAKKIINMGHSILYNKFGFSNKTINNIVSDKDPKCYTKTEIKVLVEGALNE